MKIIFLKKKNETFKILFKKEKGEESDTKLHAQLRTVVKPLQQQGLKKKKTGLNKCNFLIFFSFQITQGAALWLLPQSTHSAQTWTLKIIKGWLVQQNTFQKVKKQ